MYHKQQIIKGFSSTQKQPLLDFLTVIIASTAFFHVNLVGEFYPAEALAALAALILWRKKSYLLREPMVKRIVVLCILWLANQIVTDIIRETPTHDLLRGWAAIIVFMFNFFGLYFLLADNLRRIYIFLICYNIGFLLKPLIQSSQYSTDQPWKFGYGPPLILLAFTLVSFFSRDDLRKNAKWAVWLIMLGGLSVYLNARSMGAFTISCALLLLFRNSRAGSILLRRIQPAKVIAGVLTVFIIFLGLLKTYEYAAIHGWLGPDAYAKYEMQSGGKLGIIVGGRVELIPAIYAVKDEPIIGHGSWAKGRKYRLLLYKLIDLGYVQGEDHLRWEIAQSDKLPVHSTLLQGWVWAGIFGALFWFAVFLLTLKSMFITYRFPNPLFAVILIMALNDLWAIFLSPYGSIMRIKWALNISLFLISMHWSSAIANNKREDV